ncbi:hypothetical protein [Streptomyces sp. NPDC002779]|uniref:hypothetical protein n=1 Tax=Streptomyces sp. NPDC002779 TaxID=3364664 RepID=UPI0036807467
MGGGRGLDFGRFDAEAADLGLVVARPRLKSRWRVTVWSRWRGGDGLESLTGLAADAVVAAESR